MPQAQLAATKDANSSVDLAPKTKAAATTAAKTGN